MNNLPVLIIAALFLGAFVLPLAGKYRRGWVGPIVTVATLGSLVSSIALWMVVNQTGPASYHVGGWPPPWGIEIYVDKLGSTMAVVLIFVASCVFAYSLYAAEKDIPASSVVKYHSLNLILLGSLCGIVLTGDIFNMFVFMEIASLAACGTISVRGSVQAIEASLRYFLLSEMGSGCVLLGIALLYMLTGHLNMDRILHALPEAMAIAPRNVAASLALIIIGFLIKAALYPLHIWLPDAHSVAPTPSSAILSGLVIKVAPFSMWRVFERVYGLNLITESWIPPILSAMAISAILIGSYMALGQTNIKRMLAYSTIGQVGYIFLGLAIGTTSAITGAFLQVISHAFIKSCLFLAAGSMAHEADVTEISDMAGLGRRMPLTMMAFSLASLAMVGIPPLSGFFAKWYLAEGALQVGRPIYVIVILAGSLIALLYSLPLVNLAFFAAPKEGQNAGAQRLTLSQRVRREGPPGTLVAILVLAIACVVLGFTPHLVVDIIK